MKFYLVILSLLLIIVCVNFTDARALLPQWQPETELGSAAVPDDDPEREAAGGRKISEGAAGEEPPAEGPGEEQMAEAGGSPQGSGTNVGDNNKEKMVEDPSAILVLVNKEYNLPADYVPPDLVQPDIPFSFTEDLPKKKMRREAAQALEELFREAAAEGVQLAGVSGYRSFQRQEAIFTARARERGEEVANRTSARPGQSEHQTGLAMDVSCSSVGYGLIQGFGETKEGIWLAQNAPDFGFIIRYPKGKEHLTGYSYEPWHLRYVGVEAAREIAAQDLILEEYLAGNLLQEEGLGAETGEGLDSVDVMKDNE